MAIRRVLQKTSLSAGNWIAVAVLTGIAGFVVGWITAGAHCYPVI